MTYQRRSRATAIKLAKAFLLTVDEELEHLDENTYHDMLCSIVALSSALMPDPVAFIRRVANSLEQNLKRTTPIIEEAINNPDYQ